MAMLLNAHRDNQTEQTSASYPPFEIEKYLISSEAAENAFALVQCGKELCHYMDKYPVCSVVDEDDLLTLVECGKELSIFFSQAFVPITLWTFITKRKHARKRETDGESTKETTSTNLFQLKWSAQ